MIRGKSGCFHSNTDTAWWKLKMDTVVPFYASSPFSRVLGFDLWTKIDTGLLYCILKQRWLIYSARLQFMWHQWSVPNGAQHDHMSCHRHRGNFGPKWMCSSLTPNSSAICSGDWDHQAFWHKEGWDLNEQMKICKFGFRCLSLVNLRVVTRV